MGDVPIATGTYSGRKVASYYLARAYRQEIPLPVSSELGRPEHEAYQKMSSDEARSLRPERLIAVLEWAISSVSRDSPAQMVAHFVGFPRKVGNEYRGIRNRNTECLKYCHQVQCTATGLPTRLPLRSRLSGSMLDKNDGSIGLSNKKTIAADCVTRCRMFQENDYCGNEILQN